VELEKGRGRRGRSDQTYALKDLKRAVRETKTKQ
jgi:hypothetical protein